MPVKRQPTGPAKKPAELHGAVWCPDHNRRECRHNSKRSHVRCHAIAMAGLDSCQKHKGTTDTAARAKGAANLMRAAFAESIASTDYADPGDVLLWAVTVSARQVAWLRSLISDRLNAAGRPAVDGDSVSVLVKLEQDERTTLTKAAKMALDAGIAERQIRMAERVSEQLVAVLRGVVAELGHDPKDPAVQAVCRKHLHLVGGPGA